MNRKAYLDDLKDEEWEQIEPILQEGIYRKAGRRGKHPRREMLNAIFYILRTGCRWRDLPHDFPPWTAVYSQFVRWQARGVFAKMNDHLRKSLRMLLGKMPEATAGIYDGGKKIKGRKRHILVDHLGLLIGGVISAANCGERDGLDALLYFHRRGHLPKKIFADPGVYGRRNTEWN